MTRVLSPFLVALGALLLLTLAAPQAQAQAQAAVAEPRGLPVDFRDVDADDSWIAERRRARSAGGYDYAIDDRLPASMRRSSVDGGLADLPSASGLAARQGGDSFSVKRHQHHHHHHQSPPVPSGLFSRKRDVPDGGFAHLPSASGAAHHKKHGKHGKVGNGNRKRDAADGGAMMDSTGRRPTPSGSFGKKKHHHGAGRLAVDGGIAAAPAASAVSARANVERDEDEEEGEVQRRGQMPFSHPTTALDASLCPRGLLACPVSPPPSIRGLEARHALLAGVHPLSPRSATAECVNPDEELESCGGCASTAEGHNCLAITHVVHASCDVGKCRVLSCRDGFAPSSNGTACEVAPAPAATY